MTVINTIKDPEHLMLTVVAEFDATPERVWSVWEDARKLEQWWGPPGWPATFTRHDFVVGGESRYHMTGPDGETHRGFWQMHLIDKPNRIEFGNGLAGPDGEPTPELLPVIGSVEFEELDNRTRMSAIMQFVDTAQMEMLLGMGMAEGTAMAIGQIDALFATSTV